MMEHERWAKYFATCNTIECFSKLIKIAQFYCSVMAIYAYVERFFLDAAAKKDNFFLVQPVSSLLKLLCTLKHLSGKQSHNIVKGDSTFLRTLRKLAKYSGANRTSK